MSRQSLIDLPLIVLDGLPGSSKTTTGSARGPGLSTAKAEGCVPLVGSKHARGRDRA
jgi:hypothetical protein